MSDNDHIDRAERIRRMREEQHGEDDGSGLHPADTGATTAPTGGAGADRDDRPAGEDETDSEGRDHDSAESDPPPAGVVENVAGTSASVPSTEEMEAAMEQTMERAETVDDPDSATDPGGGSATGPAGVTDSSTTRETDTRVLEFTLAAEQYCLDIEYIEEIVKQEAITRVPNTPEFVEGVVDLRGQITTILNPKVAIGKDDRTAGDLVVVFDAGAFDDQGAIGWVVDDVRQVSPVTDDQVNDPPMGEDYINGVIDREDDEEFVIWTTPELALEEAE
jgi:purine-binding chemotaxis protein CheW